ncbi:hypothetical protein NAT47_11950 [Flavobacterium sp. HXWNR69]|uniref:Uncharacterized protein n=1 Tax=Flavobacterium fragile TaxID=2949085 RepID=A0ABT0TJI1_9FLAO|nr:hypothetical protein [Flavobacterium sp. HXWNR69]MCL9771128.1 hypothetical protein [Flavobacterium sp. HXWNR69]
MKKITLLIAFIGMITLQSCTKEEVIVQDSYDNDTISEVFEVTRSFNAANNYSALIDLGTPIYASDMILVYHLYDVIGGQDVWRLMPQTYYFNDGGELDYNFDFTRNDVNIFLDANFPLIDLSSAWTQNQTFRIVIVPGYFSNRSATQVNLKDFNAVVQSYGINLKTIKTLE